MSSTLPIRRPMAPPKPPTAKAQNPPDEAQVPPAADQGYLSFGAAAETKIKASQEAAGNSVFEFYFTKGERANAIAQGKPGPTALVHFVRNYAKRQERVCAPRCSIKVGDKFKSYTSAGADCALAAAGVNVSVRPVFVLVDHREFKRQDGTVAKDTVKPWIPPPATLGVFQNALTNLADNLGIPEEQVDITKYPAKITLTGTGTKSQWIIDFIVKPQQLSQEAINNIHKFCDGNGDAGYKAKLHKILAPDPRFLISKGGTYVKPVKYDTQAAADGGDEPPY